MLRATARGRFGSAQRPVGAKAMLFNFTDQAMTKHYFIAGAALSLSKRQRIASKLAESLAPEVAQALKDKPLTPLSSDLKELGTNMAERIKRDFNCVGLDYNAFYPGETRLEALENLLNVPEQPDEYQVFFYHSDHLGSSSFITDINGDATQHLQYACTEPVECVPFGEDFVHQQNTAAYYTPYTFSGKERDVETNLSYFGARYYESSLSIWLSVDPLSDKYPSLSAYNYCALNPVMLVDPDGMQISTHTDESGNVVAKYDDGDDGVYVHGKGTTKSDIDQQRVNLANTGGSGKKIGEIGGDIDVSSIMANKLKSSAKDARNMNVLDYFFAVKPGGKWDLKANKSTIFGVAWASDKENGTKTKFSFAKYTNMSAADVGNYHAEYTGRFTYGGTGMSYPLLWRGAGAAETAKSVLELRLLDAGRQVTELIGPPFVNSGIVPYGDRPVDFMWNTIGMSDADRNKRR